LALVEENLYALTQNTYGYALDEDVLYLTTEKEEYIFNDLAARFIEELINSDLSIDKLNCLRAFDYQVQAYILKDWLIKNNLIEGKQKANNKNKDRIEDLKTNGGERSALKISSHSRELHKSRRFVLENYSFRIHEKQEELDKCDWIADTLSTELRVNCPTLIHNSNKSICIELMENRLQGLGKESLDTDNLYIPVIVGKDRIEIGPIYDSNNKEYRTIMNQRQLIRAGVTHLISGNIPFTVPNRNKYNKTKWQKIMKGIIHIIEYEIEDLDNLSESQKTVWTMMNKLIDDKEINEPSEIIRKHKIHKLTLTEEASSMSNNEVEQRIPFYSQLTKSEKQQNHLKVPILEKLKEFRCQPKCSENDGGHRICSVNDTRSRIKPFIDSVTGIVDKVELTSISKEIFEYRAGRVFGATNKAQRNTNNSARSTGQPVSAAGKGRTAYQSQVSCIAEAIERYSANHPVLQLPTITASYSEIKEIAIDPNKINLFSEYQYDNREEINKNVLGVMHMVPKKLDLSAKENWSPIVNMLDPNCSKLVPTSMMGYNYKDALQVDSRLACSNGLSSGNSVSESIIQGLYEIIERDSCAIWWYNKLILKKVPIPKSISEYVSSVRCSLNGMQRTFELLKLPTDLDVSVIAAISHRRNGKCICVGLGCHASYTVAVSRAITEMYQMLLSEKYYIATEKPGEGNGGVERIMKDWLLTQSIEDHSYLNGKELSEDDMEKEEIKFNYIEEELEWLLNSLKKAGMTTYASNYTNSSIGFPVTKVFVPGMRHFWPRFAEGRLYDMPVMLGYMQKKKSESELNKIGFFF